MSHIQNPSQDQGQPAGGLRTSYLVLLIGSAVLLALLLSRSVVRSDSGNLATEYNPPASSMGEPNVGPPKYDIGTADDHAAPHDVTVDAESPLGSVQGMNSSQPAAPEESRRETGEDATSNPETVQGRPLDHTTNILILGSDRRPDEWSWRTDVIILLAMNLERQEAALVSFPRDIYVDPIPRHMPNRINVIDFLGEQDEPDGGGPKLLASILAERLQVPIHYYVRFDFQGFSDVIDALGGLTIPVDCPLYEHYPEENIHLALEPGEQTLTGPEALSYVRSRRVGGDLERVRRQQRVVWALRRQLVADNLLPRVPALYAALRETVQTDVGLISAVKFARFGFSLTEDDVHGEIFGPPDALTPAERQGMQIFLADWPFMANRIQTVFDRPPFVDTNTVGNVAGGNSCP